MTDIIQRTENEANLKTPYQCIAEVPKQEGKLGRHTRKVNPPTPSLEC